MEVSCVPTERQLLEAGTRSSRFVAGLNRKGLGGRGVQREAPWDTQKEPRLLSTPHPGFFRPFGRSVGGLVVWSVRSTPLLAPTWAPTDQLFSSTLGPAARSGEFLPIWVSLRMEDKMQKGQHKTKESWGACTSFACLHCECRC